MAKNPFSLKARKEKKIHEAEIKRNQTLVLSTINGSAQGAYNPGMGATWIDPQFIKLKDGAQSSIVKSWDEQENQRKIMNECAWAYERVPAVWTAFNRISQLAMKAIKLDPGASNEVKAFYRKERKLRTMNIMIVNSLKYGTMIYEPTKNGFKVRDTRYFQWEQDTDGTIKTIKQMRTKDGEFDKPLAKDAMKFMTMFPRFTDDKLGIPAPLPALTDIRMLRDLVKRGHQAFRQYGAPQVWIETPVGVDLADRQDIQDQLRTYTLDTRLVLPPGCKVHSNFERGQFVYGDLVKLLIGGVVMAMGIGPIGLGLQEGSNRTVFASPTQQSFLYDHILPFAETLSVTLEEDYDELFKKGGTTQFHVSELSASDVLRKAEADMKLSLSIWRLQQAIDGEHISEEVRKQAQLKILKLLDVDTTKSV